MCHYYHVTSLKLGLSVCFRQHGIKRVSVIMRKKVLHKKLQHLSIRNKILIAFTLLLFLSNVLIISTALHFYKNWTRRTVQQNYSNSLALISNSINSYFTNVRQSAYAFAYTPTVQSTFRETHETPYAAYRKDEAIREMLQSIEFSTPGVCTYFVSKTNGKIYKNFEGNYNFDYRQEEWYQLMEETDITEYIMFDTPQNYLEEDARYPNFCIIFKIFPLGNHRVPAGYLVYDIERTQLESLLTNNPVQPEFVFAIDEFSNVLYSNHAGTTVESMLLQKVSDDRSNGILDLNIERQDYLVVYNRTVRPDWTFVYASSYDTLMLDLPCFYLFLAFLCIIILFFIFILALHLTRLITHPIEALALGVEQMEKQNFNFKLAVTSYDEVGILTKKFNSMVDKIDYLVNRSRDAEFLQKQIELEALQQQVNPHFLYNTLELIMGLSSQNNTRMVTLICQSLGNMFRYNLTGREFVPVRDEIRYVHNYALILETRFENRFQFFMDIDPTTLDLAIPKFIIQPLIENAVNHGFDDFLSSGIVTLQIKKLDSHLWISIRDNGVGIASDILQEISALMKSGTSTHQILTPSKHTGILNIYFRLQLHFKNDFAFSIKRKNPGTEVVMELPARNLKDC